MTTHSSFEFFFQWHLTEACNLRCKHCYQQERTGAELPLDVIADTVSEASDMLSSWSDSFGIAFSRSMHVTGGEPLLRDDLFAVLEIMKRHGFAVHVLTNGTLVDRACAARLAAVGVDGVQVSMEGAAGVHDVIRGPETFARAADGLAHLVESGLTVTLNATLWEQNAGDMQALIEFASRAGAKRVGFSRLVPAGAGGRLISRMLPPGRVRLLYSSLLQRGQNRVEIVTGDPVAAQMKDTACGDRGDTARSGCAAGLSGLSVQSNGDVVPCRRLPVVVGNVQKDSLRGLWATSPVLEALRDRSRYTGRCRACARWAACRGCRAIAYAWSAARGKADILADDPQCFLTDAECGIRNAEQ